MKNIWPYTAVVLEEQTSFKNQITNVLKEDIFVRIITLEQLRKINRGGDDDLDPQMGDKKKINVTSRKKKKANLVEDSESSSESSESSEDSDDEAKKKKSFGQKIKEKVKNMCNRIKESYQKTKKSMMIQFAFL